MSDVTFPTKTSKGLTVRQRDNQEEAQHHVAEARAEGLKPIQRNKLDTSNEEKQAKRAALRQYLGPDAAVAVMISNALSRNLLKINPCQWPTGTLGWSVMGRSIPMQLGGETYGLTVSCSIYVQDTKGTPQITE